MNKVKKSFTGRPGDLFFCDALDRKQTIFECWPCATENLLEFWFHQNFYKLNDIDLSRETNVTISHQINFKEK